MIVMRMRVVRRMVAHDVVGRMIVRRQGAGFIAVCFVIRIAVGFGSGVIFCILGFRRMLLRMRVVTVPVMVVRMLLDRMMFVLLVRVFVMAMVLMRRRRIGMGVMTMIVTAFVMMAMILVDGSGRRVVAMIATAMVVTPVPVLKHRVYGDDVRGGHRDLHGEIAQ